MNEEKYPIIKIKTLKIKISCDMKYRILNFRSLIFNGGIFL